LRNIALQVGRLGRKAARVRVHFQKLQVSPHVGPHYLIGIRADPILSGVQASGIETGRES
jgi:hypothetical protein